MARKYSKYQIKVTYTNGDTENIKLSGIDNGSYKAMLDMYKQIKERYKDAECTIDFVGVSDTGEIGILFTKEIKNNNKPWFQLEAEQYTEKNMFELIQQLHDTINLIERRAKWMTGELDILNKMQDIELHKIEHYEDNLGEEEKKSIFDNLRNIRVNRRIIKEDIKTYDEYNRCFKGERGCLRKILSDRKNRDEIPQSYLTERVLKDKKIFTKVPYNTIEEKLTIIDKLKGKYSKISFNDAKREVIAYNKAQ